MPTYTFENLDTGEVFEEIMSWDKRCEFLENNPHIQPKVASPALIGGVSMDSGRLPEGYKDKLRLIKQKHPKARGVDHLI